MPGLLKIEHFSDWNKIIKAFLKLQNLGSSGTLPL
jgi:hypothetical protein